MPNTVVPQDIPEVHVMTAYSGRCSECQGLCDWIECPTGGWWAHREHPADDHDARIDWQPIEHMDDHGEWSTV